MSIQWNRFRAGFAGTGLVLVTGMLLAQTSGTTTAPQTASELAAEHVARLTTHLSLTATEQATATALFTTAETSLATIRASLKNDESALQAAIAANDTAAIEAESAAIGTLQGQATLARAEADSQLYRILSGEQQTKFKKMLQTGRGHENTLLIRPKAQKKLGLLWNAQHGVPGAVSKQVLTLE